MRIFRKHWMLAAIAVFSLSIAMALGVVSLSVANTFLLQPPAASAPNRLVMIHARSTSEVIADISYPDYEYLCENNHVFLDLAAAPISISVNDERNFENREVKILSRPVSDNYLAVMGIRPFLGRLFSPEDDESKTSVAVMMYSCWIRLGADPNIVGKVLAKHTIIGVTPKEFTGSLYGINGDLLTLLTQSDDKAPWRTQRDARRLRLLGRLKPGISRSQAQAEMMALAGQLAAAYPKDDKDRTVVVTRATLLPPDAIPTAELVIAILMAVVLLVLLIACANVANLLLAIAVGRRQEASIKLALGATRGRLVGEFLQESAIICAVSAALGYFIAAVAITRYSDFNVDFPMVGALPFALSLRLDSTVAAFTIGLMLIAILAAGLTPALYASEPSLSQVLTGEIAVGGTGKNVRRSALVIVQIAVCTVVLVGMGLCQRSLYNLRHADPGFSARNLVAMQVSPKNEGSTEAQAKELFENLRRQVSAMPGVESVSMASALPLLGVGAEPVQLPDASKKIPVDHAAVDADYFDTFGIRVLAGRVFNSFDRESGPEVVVINHKMAEMFWPGQDAVGRAVSVGETARKATVVGIVGDGRYQNLDEGSRPFLYYALSQHYQGWVDVIARTKRDPRLWVTPLTQTSRALDLMILNPVTFDSWMDQTLLNERIAAGCVAALSAMGLLLAIIGLFGAISYSVSERRKELGIRVALGAAPSQLFKMVLRQTLWIAGAGIAIGLLLGVGAGVVLRSQLYAVSAIEWIVLLPVAAAMLVVILVVAYLSARPWIAIQPMEAVRHT
jgi:predicted permease